MSIIVGCPIRNRKWTLLKYLEAIYNIDYPKKDLLICFLVNDSTDGTLKYLNSLDFRQYNLAIVKEKNYNFESCERELGRNTDKFLHFAQVRNDWISLFKDIPNVTHVFSIDSDVLVPKNSLRKLLKNNVDICSALVINSDKKNGYGKDITNIFNFSKERECYENLMEYPKKSLFECDVTGSCILYTKKVIDSIQYQAHPLGEDFGFCCASHQRGFKVWVDTTIETKHVMKKEDLGRIF